MPIRVLSNFPALAHYAGITFERYGRGRLREFLRSFRCDYLVLNYAATDLNILLMLKWLCPFNRCRIVSMDLILPPDRNIRDRLTRIVKRLLFRKLHLAVLYFRDTSEYSRLYGLRPDQLVHVPFKINAIAQVEATVVTDKGYIFSGGQTRRDYATLFQAVRGLPFPIKIVCQDNVELQRHDSYLDHAAAPGNVEIIHDDGSVRSFLNYLAGARLVVLPLKRENISASGLGVYLQAMALGKCVVITDGPATRGVLPDGCAVIVPPGDASSLREAIVATYTDAELRNQIARKGREYAQSLGGEDRLRDDIGYLLTGVRVAPASPVHVH